jgi:hypothetical protein
MTLVRIYPSDATLPPAIRERVQAAREAARKKNIAQTAKRAKADRRRYRALVRLDQSLRRVK